MTAGTLAITGVGIIGVFGFAGFYSKDAIIEAAFASGGQAGYVAFAVGVFAALLTSFYSWRLVFLTFFGKARWAGSEHIQHAVHGDHETSEDEGDGHGHDHGHHAHAATGTAGYHPHESPWPMLVPLGVLTLGAVFAGFLFHNGFIDVERNFWNGSVAFDTHLMHAMHEVPLWVKLSPAVVMLIGLFLAWNSYIRNPALPAAFVAQFRGLHRFLMHKWYFDELYDAIFVRPALSIGRFFWKKGDVGTIDRFGPDGVAAVVAGGSVAARRLQTGYVYTYALVMLLGIAAAATWAMVR
jgi:NADH-quinone oxidoreductase subunit L